jgi:hypothetical protein
LYVKGVPEGGHLPVWGQRLVERRASTVHNLELEIKTLMAEAGDISKQADFLVHRHTHLRTEVRPTSLAHVCVACSGD